MGNCAIIIRSVGIHGNGLSHDAEQIARRCVEELKAAGHSVVDAVLVSGGEQHLLTSSPNSSSVRGYLADDHGVLKKLAPGEKLDWQVTDPDEPAKRAYQRYCHASGNKSLVSGAELPPYEDLSDAIKAAWRAVADPSAPRHF